MTNNSGNTTSSASGIGFFGLLAIVFIVLKLMEIITWSWIWVLSPIWGGIVLSLLILGIIAIVLSRR